ncbi:MAG TPA: FecR domain-containing protein [Puia sp.]|jgi:ferric-dicitrate binding protein FerR (iron transport regulator)
MEERVKYLFRKFLGNTCTKEEFDEVFLYLGIKENEPLFRELIREMHYQQPEPLPSGIFIDESGELKGIPALSAKRKDGNSHPLPRSGKTRKTRKITAFVLAFVCIALGITMVVWQSVSRRGSPPLARVSPKSRLLKHATRPSEYKHLLLPDSTRVWLNAGSTLEFTESFGTDNRNVVLTGEAFFDVTHSDKLPFIIYTGRVSTEVLGTSFNIKAYPDLEKIVVAVKKGKVKVSFADKQVALLTMGQQVSIGNKDSSVKEIKMKAEDAASWQHGDLVYDDYTIENIISDLERVYNVKIRIGNPSLADIRISTAFKRQDGVVKALEVLSELTDTKFSLID